MNSSPPTSLPSLPGRTGLRRCQTEIALGLALVLLTVYALGPVCACGFVNYDDGVYVTNNLSVLGGLTPEDVGWAFTATVSNHWHPLTWISLQADADLYQLRPWGFHLTNLLLHVGNVLLLFAVLRRMTGSAWRGAAAAAFFAVHPLRVESVAWVTERKDVLSTFFWLLTTAAYVHYARKPGGRRYAWVLLLFIPGLLAKSMLMTLPCTLLLLDYWPLRRFPVRHGSGGEREKPDFAPASFPQLVREKLPLFFLAIVSGAVSLYARRQGGGLKSGEYLGLGERFGYALNAYAQYVVETFWPVGLAPFYPLTPGGLPAWRVVGAAALLVVLTLVLLGMSRRRPYLLVGWLWYLGTLFPVSGVVQGGSSMLADRFTYVPSIGLYIAFVWAVADLIPRAAHARLLAPAAALLLLAAALATRQQVSYWRDSIALWEHTQAVTADNFPTRTDLGLAYQEAGRFDEAESQLVAAIRLRPDLAIAYANLGRLYLLQGRLAEATARFREAVERQPGEARFRNQLGQSLKGQGQAEAAEKEFEAARELSQGR